MFKSLITLCSATIIVLMGLTSFINSSISVDLDNASALNGKATLQVESQLKEAIGLREEITQWWAKLVFTLFNEGKKGVIIGEGGWLFSREEYEWPKSARANIDKNVNTIVEFNQKLAAKDIQLALILVPEKVSIYTEFTDKESAHLAYSLYAEVARQLQGQHVNLVLPDRQLIANKAAQPQFLRTDTHWTPQGANTVAQASADHLAKWVGSVAFETELAPLSPHHGDLYNFIPIETAWLYNHIPPDNLAPPSTFVVTSEDDPFSGDLFGDVPELTTALVGTSYSANPAWNFHGYLQQAMALEILDYSKNGQGPLNPMEAFLSSSELEDGDITLVLWEFPVRYFVQDLSVMFSHSQSVEGIE